MIFPSVTGLHRKEKHDYGKRICKKKGKKWYYRFYVEDQSGNLVQKEYAGTESKSKTGPIKRKKVRIVDFGDTLTEILRNARKKQLKNRMQYGKLYHKNYYREVKAKNRVYYEFYHLDGTEEIHLHKQPVGKRSRTKGCQELLGHSDFSTTMNVYAHPTRKAKRESARLSSAHLFKNFELLLYYISFQQKIKEIYFHLPSNSPRANHSRCHEQDASGLGCILPRDGLGTSTH